MKVREKELAIQLRKTGKSYSEILAQVPVSKSTLSLWLRSVGLAKKQKQIITEKRKLASLRGARARKQKRIQETITFETQGIQKVKNINKRELWLIGVSLYWAEGSKQSKRSPSTAIQFGNSDPRMLRVFLSWLTMLEIPTSERVFELYIHEDRKNEINEFKCWWAKELKIPETEISRIYIKKGNRSTRRTNTGDLYHGLFRIKVRRSTLLNRQVHGWISAVEKSVLGDRLMVGQLPLKQ